MAVPTHYEVLGVHRNSATDEIKRAYHEAARRHHPDVGAGDGAAMAAVNAAWAVLGDPSRRAEYDRALAAATDPTAYAAAGAPTEDDPVYDEDVPSWAVETDIDERTPGLRSQVVVLVPVALLGLSAASFALSLMMSAGPLMAVALLLLPVAGVGFVAAPLLMMRLNRRAAQAERSPSREGR